MAHSRAALPVAEDVGEEHVGVLAVGLEQHDVGVAGTARRYLSMPTCMREWMIARNVCAEHQRQAALVQLVDGQAAAARAPALASNGTSGLTHSSSPTPSSSATDACSVLFSAPST